MHDLSLLLTPSLSVQLSVSNAYIHTAMHPPPPETILSSQTETLPISFSHLPLIATVLASVSMMLTTLVYGF
jgi:hypothetical protein